MTNDPIEQLRAAAMAASPSPWLHSRKHKCVDVGQRAANGTVHDGPAIRINADDEQADLDLAYIALANPAVILALLDRLAKAAERDAAADLGAAVRRKFNIVSERRGSAYRLPAKPEEKK